MQNGTAIYLYWDSHVQFKTKLYPIAEAAYYKLGIQAIVATVCWRTFYNDMQSESWLNVHPYDDLVVERRKENETNQLRKIISFFRRRIQEKKYWRTQAEKLIDLYKPMAIFLWAPDAREVPWLMKLAKAKKIPTLFVGENNIIFGYSHVIKMNRRSILIAAMEQCNNKAWLQKIFYFSGIYLEEWLEKFLYLIMGIWGWKRQVAHFNSASFHLVSSENYRNELIKLGANKHKVVVTSIPEHDELFKWVHTFTDLEALQNARQLLNVPQAKRLVVFLLENFPAIRSELKKNEVNDLIQDVIEAVITVPSAQLLIKLHPRDDESSYFWIKEKYPTVQLLKNMDTLKLIAMTDLLLAHGTTAAGFGPLAKKPTFIVNFKDQWICEAIQQSFDIPVVKSKPELIVKITESLNSDFELQINNSKLGLLDGNAVMRILNFSGLDQLNV